MVPVRRTQTWLPDIFNDFFDNTWMEKTNATAPESIFGKPKQITKSKLLHRV